MRCYRCQEHLQPVDQDAVEALLNQPEHFHRALPAWVETRVENDLLARTVPITARY